MNPLRLLKISFAVGCAVLLVACAASRSFMRGEKAARAGDSARGFVAVAAEVRNLAVKAQELANELRAGLNKNSVLTVSTFQDIQAGGKLMIAAVSGLGASVNTLRARID